MKLPMAESSKHATGYKAAFYTLVVVVTVMAFSAIFILNMLDKSPSYILDRMLWRLSVPTESSALVFLPEYYYEDLGVLPHTFSKHVRTLEDFEEWKNGPVLKEQRTRPTIHQVPHDATMLFSEERDGYVLSKFAMTTFYPDDIIFYKLAPTAVPAGGDARGTVLVIPGSGNQGALDVLGEPSPLSPYYYQDEIAKRLVKEGYDVYAIELHGYGEREFDVGQACNNRSDNERRLTCPAAQLDNRLAMYGISLHSIQTDEITQVLAHMVYDEGADSIAVAGLSLGAGHAISQAVINSDVVDAVVVASGIASHANSPISHQAVGRNQLQCCDSNDEAATIAPKPMYVSFGKNEVGGYGWEASTNHTGDFLMKVYALHNAADNFYYHVHDGAHQYHIETVIDFLETHVGR